MPSEAWATSTLVPATSRDLVGRCALITGGASGLGLGCANLLAARGASLVLVDVNADALETAAQGLRQRFSGVAVRTGRVDLADLDSVDALAVRLLDAGEALDWLIANAGIYPPSRRVLNAQGVELGFAIAVLGHFALTARVWPLLQRAPAARVVCISSLVQRYARIALDDLALDRGYWPFVAYRQAKLGSLLWSRELQRRLCITGSPMRAQSAHPGVCRTNIGANRPRDTGDTPWQRFSTWALAFGMRFYGQTPEQGAAAVIEAATSMRIAPGDFVGPTGTFEAAGPIGVVQPGRFGRDPELGRQLWARLETLSGLTFPV